MQIKKITIQEYKIFKEAEIDFNSHLTTIIGNNGTGKTILFNMLKEGLLKKNKDYCVETEGEFNPKNLKYVFINPKSLGDILKEESIQEGTMYLPAGERILISFFLLLAIRRLKGINDPLVFDVPFGSLSGDKRKAILSILKQLPHQIVIIALETELQDMNINFDYRLVYDRQTSQSTLKKWRK